VQRIFLGTLFLMLTLTFVSDGLRGQPILVATDRLEPLTTKVTQIKVGVMVGNDVFSYDDFRTVAVVYPNWESGPNKAPTITVPHSVLQWFIGDLATKTVRPAPLPTRIGVLESEPIEYPELRLQWDDERIQRWCYKGGSFWCIPERVVQFFAGGISAHSYNALFPALYRTDPKNAIHDGAVGEWRRDEYPHERGREDGYGNNDIERLEWISAIPMFPIQSFSTMSTHRDAPSTFTDVNFKRQSLLPPLQPPTYYDYLSGGFDFLPISRNHWWFCTLIVGPEPSEYFVNPPRTRHFVFTLWEARSRVVERDGVSGYENKWTVLSQSFLAWGGKFFAVPIKNTEGDLLNFHLIRDGAPTYILAEREVMVGEFLRSYAVSGELYRLDIAEADKIDEDRKPCHWQWFASPSPEWRSARTLHCEKPVLDPEKHRIIALIYMEPEGKVYGFGRNFYIRLDVLPENGDLASAIIPCRDITEGEISGRDHTGKERVICEPFRTVWQAARILHETR